VNARRLVLRGLLFHWPTHLGALLTAALAAAVVTAALSVGDSVSASLSEVADARLGRIRYAAHARDRSWRAALATDLAGKLGTPVAPALILSGSVSLPDGSARVADARVLGVDDTFWSFSPGGLPPLDPWPDNGIAVSELVARRLSLSVGDALALRVERPASVPRDAPLGTDSDATATLLLEVVAICDTRSFGSFSLSIGQVPPANVFLPLGRLQRAVEAPGRTNALLLGDAKADLIAAATRETFVLEDTGLTLRPVNGKREWELLSPRVFLEAPAERAALGIDGAWGALTWLVNDLTVGDRQTPYSMVAALPREHPLIPDDLGDDEILVNTWLAEDLGAAAGDRISLAYYVLGEGLGLTERTTEFRIRAVVPIAGDAADRDLMPAFPGLTDAEDCREWDPGFALDLSRIRDKDEAYWDNYEGTPKAFLGLTTGQRLWGNRFGDLTAVRFPGDSDPVALGAAIRARLDPAAFGLSFTDLNAAEAAARSKGMDFGTLFLSFSAFLMAAALLLNGLVVALNMAMRQGEIATLLALGFAPGRIRRLFTLEHLPVVLAGGVVGVLLGIALAAGAVAALGTVWSDVAGSLLMTVVARPTTLLAGALGGAAVSFAATYLVIRRIVRGSVKDAFTKDEELAARISHGRARGGLAVFLGLGFLVAATATALLSGTGRDPATAGAFFGAGAMLLIAALLFLWYVLAHLGGVRAGGSISLGGLAWRNLGRRRGRSLATIGILAFGVFMFLGVTVFRRDRLLTSDDRASGTGGFALVGESAVAVAKDLDTPEGRRFFALLDEDLRGVRVVGLSVRAGDDASCRSLTRAQAPEIVGVDPEALRGRFTFVKVLGTPANPWEVLAEGAEDGPVPAVIDQATFWTLGRGVGDEIDLTDEEGRTFTARIAGVIDNAVLHGHLIVSRSAFQRHFPSEGGDRRFLIDAPADRVSAVAALLSRQLEDRGLILERSEVRLNSLNAVENTYLAIFQALGGIGLLLGSAGLFLVVGRNTAERRGELALLGAVGFTRRRIIRLVSLEHTVLLILGLLTGISASTVSLLPALLSPGAEVATFETALVLLGLGAGGMLFTHLAARAAQSGPLLSNLREE
jgi:putative ABC transport system permease protein